MFKAAKMSETAFETQAAFVKRGVGEEALSLESTSCWRIWDVTLTSLLAWSWSLEVEVDRDSSSRLIFGWEAHSRL